MTNKQILGAPALDLKRAALGTYRGSNVMASRFIEEVQKRKQELTTSELPDYIQKIVQNLDVILADKDEARKAEDFLMYSTLIQNYAVKKQV